MKKIVIYITALLMAVTSSCDFLDKEVDLSITEDVVFSDFQQTRDFLANVYGGQSRVNLYDPFDGILNDGQFLGTGHEAMTNNMISYWNVHRYHSILTNSYSSADHWFAQNTWTRVFRGVRAANVFMKNARETVVGNNVVEGDNNRLYDRYMAEARLLRAIFHFDAAKWYGPVPIIGDDASRTPIVFELEDTEAMNMSRTPCADVLKWIADECDAVKDILPYRYSNIAENFGRVNGATAYALKSRALLYRASPLNNTNNNLSWWEEAAQAALDMIAKNDSESNNFQLYRTATNDVNRNYYECFITTPYYNNEYILTGMVGNNRTVEGATAPVGFTGSANATGRMNPTQNLVDSYETINGLPIDKDPTYDPQNPYVNRDPRLQQSIFHHGMIWGDPIQEEERALDMTYGRGADYQELHGGTYTGYYPKKYVNNMSWKVPSNYLHAFPLFRYGEVFLNAAEAINEAYGPDEAYQYVNQIRERVGMPPYSGMTQAHLRERLRIERRVEFFFEEHWWFDERRWKMFEEQTIDNEKNLPYYLQVYNIYGVTIRPDLPQLYNYGPAQLHPYRSLLLPKNYYFPIPDTELKKAPNLGQNSGWELAN